MHFPGVSIAFSLIFLFTSFSACSANPAFLQDGISVNCGTTGTSATLGGREWIGDKHPKFSLNGKSTSSRAIHNSISGDPFIHKTARVSHSLFSYSFYLNPGQVMIRFHFNPTSYKGFKSSKDFFNVEAGPFTLMSNFSASITAQALGLSAIAKEFYMTVQENQALNIVFSSSVNPSQYRTHAFINGIEIIYVPTHLSYFHNRGSESKVVGRKSPVYIDNSTALEIVHRLNVKHESVMSGNEYDVLGTWATFLRQKANEINNRTWKRSVDVGFRYLVRIHFCELGLKVAGNEHVVFKVHINEMIVDTNADIVKETKENGDIWYMDYLVMMKGRKQDDQRDILITLHSNNDFIERHKLLEGFEIFKLSNPDNSLASPNPLPPAKAPPSWFIRFLLLRNVVSAVAVIMIALVSIIAHTLLQYVEANVQVEENKPSARAERLCRRFSLAEIQSATRNFSNAFLIGRGGFGKVYKGQIDNGQETVAIKRLSSFSQQGKHEFLTEIETLSELRHINLVSLIGYCNECREMILVYEYISSGTLSDHLYKLARRNNCDSSSLTWKQRLSISIGAARGIDYLHTGHNIIHRDLKTSNILLDENFVAKVADFGLAKPEDRGALQSHICTHVKGTCGYLDPHYRDTGRLTRKSDTYAFGVVLLQVLCGRPVIDPTVGEDEYLLTNWARSRINMGEMLHIVAPCLMGEITPNSLTVFVRLAESCLHDEPKKRPTMAQVVAHLELAIEQQDNRELSTQNQETIVVPEISPYISTDVQKVKPAATEWTNSKVANTELARSKEAKKLKLNKTLRLWTWDALWNMIQPSKKNEFVIKNTWAEFYEASTFTIHELQVASDNFSDNNIIGRSEFSIVYKGRLADGSLVAIGRMKEEHIQGEELQFQTEVEIMSIIEHQNLLHLRGFCMTSTERLLVYPYMANGSVASRLRNRPESEGPLDWKIRKRIALGSATGLAYLHDHDPKIIHRDVKASHVLLDEDLNAVMGGFGLAKLLNYNDTHVITVVRGTIYHIDKDYLFTGKLSEKADVFGYGIMLLELITGHRAFDIVRLANDDDVMLLDWVRGLLIEKKLEILVDVDLAGSYIDEDVEQLTQIALLCAQDSPKKRPTMSEVVRMLESGDGLAQRWEESQKEKEFENNYIITDDISDISADELSEAR